MAPLRTGADWDFDGCEELERRAAMHNELAKFRAPLSLQQVLSARWIVEPLDLYEVPAFADGAVCLVLAFVAAARELGRPFVTVVSRGFCHDGHHQFGSTPHDITSFEALRRAPARAFACLSPVPCGQACRPPQAHVG